MGADIIQAQYDQLAAVAQRFGTQAKACAAMQQQLLLRMQPLEQGGWQGRGSASFCTEMQNDVLPGVGRLIAALEKAQTVTEQTSHLIRQAEENAAAPFRGEYLSGQAPEMATTSLPRLLIDVAKGVVDAVDFVDDWAAVPAGLLLATGLASGGTYLNQVIVKAPDWLTDLGISGRWLRGAAGVSENLTHIKSANMAAHIGKQVGKLSFLDKAIAIGQGIARVADTWERHSAEYAGYDGSELIVAGSFDAGLALLPVVTEIGGGIIGAKLGANIGAGLFGLLGSVVPIAGTAVGLATGAVIGGVVGGLAGDWLGGMAGEIVVNTVEDSGVRDGAISWLDQKVAQPVSESIRSAMEYLDGGHNNKQVLPQPAPVW